MYGRSTAAPDVRKVDHASLAGIALGCLTMSQMQRNNPAIPIHLTLVP